MIEQHGEAHLSDVLGGFRCQSSRFGWYGYARNRMPNLIRLASCVNCCRVAVVRPDSNGSATVRTSYEISSSNEAHRMSGKRSFHAQYRFHQRRYTVFRTFHMLQNGVNAGVVRQGSCAIVSNTFQIYGRSNMWAVPTFVMRQNSPYTGIACHGSCANASSTFQAFA